jgi:N6-adenosine-specific RNA methylase IME4
VLVKVGHVGTGYWGRSAHELVLIGARGSGTCFSRGKAPPSAFAAPKGRHSKKPPDVHNRIEGAWPDVPKLELFAREHRPGWWCWGDEVGVVDPDGHEQRQRARREVVDGPRGPPAPRQSGEPVARRV